MRNNDYTVESVDNALRLLLMLQSEGSVRLSDAATELGVARSTVHRLLGTMVSRGFAVQDERRRYVPGPAFFASSSYPVNARLLRSVARPHLTRLSEQVQETTHLLVRDGSAVRFVDSVEGSQALRVGGRVGVTLPAYLTSGGKALLAELDRSQLDQLYADDPLAPPSAALIRTLAAVRRRGYGTNVGETERGLSAVGVCVRTPDGAAVAAMTISAPSLRLTRARMPEMATAIRDAVRQVEQDLTTTRKEQS